MASHGHAAGSDQLKEGWLVKEPIGKSGIWRKRYFIYRNNALFYYEDKPKNITDKAKGMFEIRADTVVRASTIQKQHAFEVFSKPVLLRVQANDKLDCLAWMNLIKEQVSAIKAAQSGVKEEKKEGYLLKRPMLDGARNAGGWKKRWFVLRNGRITYYEDRPGPNDKPKGVMELTPDTKVITIDEKNSTKPYTFEVTAKKLVLTVSADSKAAMSEWISALDSQILMKAGITAPGPMEIAVFCRAIGLSEYARGIIDRGYDELAALWDLDAAGEQKLTEELELTRMEKDTFDESWKRLKKAKKPESHKAKKAAAVARPKPVYFSMEPPPKGATTRLYTWGNAEHGQLGLIAERTGERVHTPTHVDALKGKSEPAFVSCGSSAMGVVTLSAEANVYTCGSGPLGLGADKLSMSRPFLVAALRDIPVRQLSCGESHMVCVTKDGEVFSWGGGDMGQLGLGPKKQGTGTPIKIETLGPKVKAPISSAACGPEHTLFVTEQGAVWACGKASDGRLGLGTTVTTPQFVPVRVAGGALEKVQIGQVACGESFSIALSKTGAGAYWWGKVSKSKPSLFAPTHVDRFTSRTISQVAAAGTVGLFLVDVQRDEATGEYLSTSSVYSFGDNPLLLGHGDDEAREMPTLIEDLEGHGVKQIAIATTHAGALTGDGRILMWGSDKDGELGSSYMVSIKRPSEAIRISGFRYTFFAVGEGFSAAIAVEDKTANKDGGNQPAGTALPPPPPSEEALQANKTEADELQAMLDQFAVFSHKFDLMQAAEAGDLPPPPPDEEEDIPPPPSETVMVKPAQKVGGGRILPPGSTDLGNGWLRHTDAKSGKHYYEEPATGKVQWTKPA